MRMIDTDSIIVEYVETYNKYMTLPDNSKELKPLEKRLQLLRKHFNKAFSV